MGDPLEGLTEAGMIRTGAAHARVDDRYRSVLDRAVTLIHAASPQASIYVYGSVATGQARSPESDIDLLTVGLGNDEAVSISARLSAATPHLCRGVDISAAQSDDLEGDHDEAYGNRVFLRHYCVHLAGPDHSPAHDFPGDAAAARGFNGDIARHAHRWHAAFGQEPSPELGRRLARKLLLAVAALVSVHDHTWTTDRSGAARRWGEVHPALLSDLATLVSWTPADSAAAAGAVEAMLHGIVPVLTDQFATTIGLWEDIQTS